MLHFQPQVVALAGALADAGKHRVAAVLLGDAGDQFLNHDGLAQPGSAEQPGLAAAHEGSEQVDDLDAGFEDLGLGGQVHEFRRLAMDRTALFHIDRPPVVHRVPQQVKHPAQRLLADRHGDRPAGVQHFHAPAESVGRAQRHRPHLAAAQMLLHFAGQTDAGAVVLHVDLDGVVDFRQLIFGKLRIKRRADDLRDLSGSGHEQFLFASNVGPGLTAKVPGA